MSIVFPGTSSDYSIASGSSTLTISPPTDTADGDLLIAFIIGRSGISSAPGAWTQLASWTTNGTFAAYSLAVPSASALPSSWSWISASTRASVLVFRVTGVSMTSPIYQTGGTSGAGNDSGFGTSYDGALPMQLPGVTGQGGYVACVGTFWAGDGDTPSSDLIPGFTQIATVTTPSSGVGRSSQGVYGMTGDGAISTITCALDWAGGPTGQNGILIGLQAATTVSEPSLFMAGLI